MSKPGRDSATHSFSIVYALRRKLACCLHSIFRAGGRMRQDAPAGSFSIDFLASLLGRRKGYSMRYHVWIRYFFGWTLFTTLDLEFANSALLKTQEFDPPLEYCITLGN